MRNSKNRIPINTMGDTLNLGISIDKNSFQDSHLKTEQQAEEATQAHRDEGYTFHILDKGTVIVEIDFNTHHISAPAVVYLHPDQVHKMLDMDDVEVSSLSLNAENINTEYLKILEELNPASPLSLNTNAYSLISSSFLLCLNFYEQKNNKLYYPLLRDSCNTLVAYLLSQFLNFAQTTETLLRVDQVSKAFRKLLDKNYLTLKRPGQYAALLYISTAYLNDCVKGSTGYSVSQLIQEKIILEAKRLLYHTDKSVKEIAFDLGYADYPYFTRLFTKIAGTSAITFRKKYHV